MINKRSIWFLTLFSLILVLSVYYITMPSELLLMNNSDYTNTVNSTPNNDDSNITVSESSVLVALRVEAEEEVLKEINELKSILTSSDATVEQKNKAFEDLKNLNVVRGEEEQLENQLSQTYNLKTFVRVKGDQVKVVVDGGEHNVELANNIMRTIQSNYQNKMYITVKFEAAKE